MARPLTLTDGWIPDKRCLPDAPWEYETKRDWMRCAQQKIYVTMAIVSAVIIAMIIVMIYLRPDRWLLHISLGMGIIAVLVGYQYFAGNSIADRAWDKFWMGYKNFEHRLDRDDNPIPEFKTYDPVRLDEYFISHPEINETRDIPAGDKEKLRRLPNEEAVDYRHLDEYLKASGFYIGWSSSTTLLSMMGAVTVLAISNLDKVKSYIL